jgi:hypothetical protein
MLFNSAQKEQLGHTILPVRTDDHDPNYAPVATSKANKGDLNTYDAMLCTAQGIVTLSAQ